MSIGDLDQPAEFIVTIGAALGALYAFARWVVPRVRRMAADLRGARDALLGREAVVDSITHQVIAPPLPGIGQRMTVVEAVLPGIEAALTSLAGSLTRLDDHDQRLLKLEGRPCCEEGR